MDFIKAFNEIVAEEPEAFEVENEECPMGDDCAIHFRNSERHRDDEIEYARFVDYVGKYVIVTDFTDATMLAYSFGLPITPSYQTEVIEVGEENAFVALKSLDDDEYVTHVKHTERFKDYTDFAARHNAVVKAVRDGELPRS